MDHALADPFSPKNRNGTEVMSALITTECWKHCGALSDSALISLQGFMHLKQPTTAQLKLGAL